MTPALGAVPNIQWHCCERDCRHLSGTRQTMKQPVLTPMSPSQGIEAQAPLRRSAGEYVVRRTHGDHKDFRAGSGGQFESGAGVIDEELLARQLDVHSGVVECGHAADRCTLAYQTAFQRLFIEFCCRGPVETCGAGEALILGDSVFQNCHVEGDAIVRQASLEHGPEHVFDQADVHALLPNWSRAVERARATL